MSTTEQRTAAPSLRQRREALFRRLQLDEKHKLSLDAPPTAFWVILAVTCVFTALGLVMVLSSSSVVSLHSGESAYRLFGRQVGWAFFGALAMWCAYKVPYHSWRKTNWLLPWVVGSLALNLIVVFVGRNINGATAWLQWGWFRLQPSEFMKIATILACAHYLALKHRYVAVRQVVLYRVLGVLAVTGGLVVWQRDFGTALVFAMMVLVLMVQASIPWPQIFTTMAGMAVAGAVVLTQADNASRRLFAFLDLQGTKRLEGYQVYQSILSIANGGLTGTGVGSGTSKWGYVPLAYSDFIFAVIAEELGFLGAVVVIGGFFLLFYFGIQAALAARDMHGALIAGGISAWFGSQMVINIGGITGVIPMTGLTLPFMSYGGSSLLATMLASGLLLNVARHPKKS
ncbi:MAG: cell division protein FtsW [Actinomycetota bacterium]|jgi:cell division protein FtsW